MDERRTVAAALTAAMLSPTPVPRSEFTDEAKAEALAPHVEHAVRLFLAVLHALPPLPA